MEFYRHDLVCVTLERLPPMHVLYVSPYEQISVVLKGLYRGTSMRRGARI